MTAALLALAGVLAAVDWVGVARDHTGLRLVGKPGTMVALIAAAIAGSGGLGRYGVDSGWLRWWIIAGLVLSLAGDVFLMLDERWFVAGLGSFLVAHLAYIVGMIRLPLSGARALIGVAVALAVAALAGRRIVAGAQSHDRALKIPVIVYVGVISVMFVIAQATGIGWLAVAATLFLISDSLLGWNRFVRPVGWMPLAVMVTYHLAQAAFVAAILA